MNKKSSKTKYLSHDVNKKVMENLSQKINILISIIKERETNFKSLVMGFHEYRKMWEPKSNEILQVKLETTDKMDKFAVAVIKNKKIIAHLPFENTGF